MQPVVVPLDGSELGETALPWAAAVARAHRLSLLLVQVVLTGQVSSELSPNVEFQYTADQALAADRYLSEVAERLRADGINVRTIVREGTPASQILVAATEHDAFAIVMATHGRGVLSRLLSGSVAAEVLRGSNLPVLLVPAAADRRDVPELLHTILVPLDGSPLAEKALPFAVRLVGTGGKLVLVRSAQPLEYPIDAHELGGTDWRVPGVDEDTYMSSVAQKLRKSGTTVEHFVLAGDATDQIEKGARARDADLIVMATRGHTGIDRMRFGSVADALVRKAACPVFLLSPRMLSAKTGDQCRVGEIMNRDIPVIDVGESLSSAMRKLLIRGAAAVPVVDSEGDLVGVLSARKLREWKKSLWEDASIDANEVWTRADQVAVTEMLPNVAITIEDSATTTAAARTLLDQQLDSLVVTHDGKPEGMVGIHEVLAALSKLAGAQRPRIMSREPSKALSSAGGDSKRAPATKPRSKGDMTAPASGSA